MGETGARSFGKPGIPNLPGIPHKPALSGAMKQEGPAPVAAKAGQRNRGRGDMHAASETRPQEQQERPATGYCAGCMRNREYFDREIPALKYRLHKLETRGENA